MGELLTSEVKKKEREISTCIKRTIYISLLFFKFLYFFLIRTQYLMDGDIY